MNLFHNRNRIPDLLIVDERDLHPFSREEWESIEIDTHPGEPFDNPNFPMNVGSGEHEGEYYCGSCGGFVPIEQFAEHFHSH